jgi:hypothetical protein
LYNWIDPTGVKCNHHIGLSLIILMKSVRAFLTLVITMLLCGGFSEACSWDYLIWQVRSKDADPLYRFVKDGRAGYIDGTGKVVVQPTLRFFGNYGGEFHNGLLLQGVGDGPYLNSAGKIALDTGFERNWEFSEGLAVAMRDGEDKWGYIDKTGKFVIEPKFETSPNGYVSPFADGLAKVRVGLKEGYIGRNGEFVIRPAFPYATDFSEGFAIVALSGPCTYGGDGPCLGNELYGSRDYAKEFPSCKLAFINKTGKTLPEQDFEDARSFSEGLAAVRKNCKWGFIDIRGKLVVPYQFDQAFSFSDGLARVGKHTAGKWSFASWGYIDKSGKLAIPFQFEMADEFSDGLAPVGTFDEESRSWGNYYYINKQVLRAFPGTFAEASHYYKGIAHVMLSRSEKKREFAYIDAEGKQIFRYNVIDGDD